MTTVSRINAPNELRILLAPPRPPGPGEALVRVAWAGIRGSDREVLANTRPAEYAPDAIGSPLAVPEPEAR